MDVRQTRRTIEMVHLVKEMQTSWHANTPDDRLVVIVEELGVGYWAKVRVDDGAFVGFFRTIEECQEWIEEECP
ncbi:MAG: hypothetical protein HKP62_01460 [Sulfurovum sp.]|nr:hypothetical protein [Sulfurovum sp.]NNJ44662.1 hypothetical protein [Sulfurovum sp.]